MARRLGVTRDDVVRAAVLVAERHGLDRLTVAAVAAEVGCRPPSVYHHVDGLEGLVAAVAEVGARELGTLLDVAGRDRTGIEALRSCVRTASSWARAHPGRCTALARPVDPDGDPQLVEARRRLLEVPRRALREAGVASSDADRWLAALVAAILGAIAVEGAGAPAHVADDEAHELLVELLLDALAP